MRRNFGAIVTVKYSILIIFAVSILACGTKLIDIDKSISKLDLSKEQSEAVVPKMESIKKLVDNYNAEKEELEEELSSMMGSRGGMMGGGKGGMGGGRRGGGMGSSGTEREGGGGKLREKMQEFNKKRGTYQSAINKHISDIKAVLNEDQLAKFEKMKQPELEELERPERGGGGRGGMGGGRGGTGGGGRRGGGKF